MFRWLEVLLFKGGGFRGGDPDVLNGGGGHTESLLFFTYIFTARRRVGWVGDALPFCSAQLLPARLFQSGKSYEYGPLQSVLLWPGLNKFFIIEVPWRRRVQPKSCLYSLGAFLPLRLCTFRFMPLWLAGLGSRFMRYVKHMEFV